MGIWTNLSAGLRSLFRKKRGEQELDEELRDYLEKSTVEKMRTGMTREGARRAARNGRCGSGKRRRAIRELGDAC